LKRLCLPRLIQWSRFAAAAWVFEKPARFAAATPGGTLHESR
jgi:hypothetical protein